MALELDSLRQSLAALERSLAVADDRRTPGAMDEALRETIRAGVIQNFEVAYEQCWKFIQRWLRENQSPAAVDQSRTRKDLFRLAARCGLIQDPIPWFEYGDARNLTSHTYSPQTADTVFNAARRFRDDAGYLLRQLEANP